MTTGVVLSQIQICQEIINLAYAAGDKNVKVSISSLTQRNDDLNDKVMLVNDALAKTCKSIDMVFTAHKNKLHLNKKR